ncbi:hypothetical protein MMC10_002645 [Thelotrema lepadinum]|nr:hypothetical protein [Thelotrema lepadinum]
MDRIGRPNELISIHAERSLGTSKYLVSNSRDLVSSDFVNKAFATSDMPWAAPLSPENTNQMLDNSTVLGLYRISPSLDREKPHKDIGPDQLEQIGMARFITDYTTFAWLTDVYVAPEHQGTGLGKWLVECCKDFIDQIPALRRAMLITSHPEQGAAFYEKHLGMSVQVQDPKRLLVMTTKR